MKEKRLKEGHELHVFLYGVSKNLYPVKAGKLRDGMKFQKLAWHLMPL